MGLSDLTSWLQVDYYEKPVSKNSSSFCWWIWGDFLCIAEHTENKVNSVFKAGKVSGFVRQRALTQAWLFAEERSGENHSAGFSYRAQPVDFMRKNVITERSRTTCKQTLPSTHPHTGYAESLPVKVDLMAISLSNYPNSQGMGQHFYGWPPSPCRSIE